MRFTVYTKACCPLCDEALEVMQRVQRQHPFEIQTIDIEGDPRLMQAYRNLIPVVTLDGVELFYGRVSAHRLREIVRANASKTGTPRSVLSPRYRDFLQKLRRMKVDQRASRDKCP